MRNPDRNRIESLFRGEAARNYTLPAPLLDAYRAEQTLHAAHKEAQLRAGEARTAVQEAAAKVRRDLQAAAEAGKVPTHFYAPVGKAQAEVPVAQQEATYLEEAVNAAADAVLSAAYAFADELITDHLRPVLEKVLSTAKEHAAVGATVPWTDPARAMESTDAMRESYLAIRDAALLYGAIRDAQRVAYSLEGDPDNATTIFGELRNLPDVWPSFQMRGPGSPSAPWPTEPHLRLIWLATSEADPWMPTRGEALAAWEARLSKARPGMVQPGGGSRGTHTPYSDEVGRVVRGV